MKHLFSSVLSLSEIEYVNSISKSLDEIIKKINRMVLIHQMRPDLLSEGIRS